MNNSWSHDDYIEAIEEIDSYGEGLNGWEISFVSSFIDDGFPYRFSPKQARVIQRIYSERIF